MTDEHAGVNAAFEKACVAHADAIAVVTPDGQTLTYSRLLETVRSFAARLRDEGVGPGLTVVPFADNPVVFYMLGLALLRIGATFGACPPADTMARAGVPVHLAVSLPDSPSSLAHANVFFDQTWFQHRGDASIGPEGDFIMSSSGTTGEPKYYRAGRYLMRSWVGQDLACYDFRDTDTLVTLPLQSAFGAALRLCVNLQGGTVLPAGASARETLKRFQPGRRAAVVTTPALLAEFVHAAEEGAPVSESLAFVMSTGSPISESLSRRAESALGCPLYNGYGSHETALNLLGRPAGAGVAVGFCGEPTPWSDVAIEGEDGRSVPDGEEGRLAILVPAQYRVEEALVGAWPYDADGRFRPGDLACCRPDGSFVVTGRVNDLINASGLKVAPWRYESVVRQLVSVTDVAAFGLRNDMGFEDVGIAIVGAEGADLDSLHRQLADRVGVVPAFRIYRMESLPLGASGKVDRAKLAGMFAAV